jgi:hypothetical protein
MFFNLINLLFDSSDMYFVFIDIIVAGHVFSKSKQDYEKIVFSIFNLLPLVKINIIRALERSLVTKPHSALKINPRN